MTGEILDAILITIPLWGPLVFVVVSDLSDSSDRPVSPVKAEGTIYGGWWIPDWLGRRVVARIRCQAPDMRLYRENWRRRRSGHGF